MLSVEDALASVFEAIDEVNMQLPAHQHVTKTPATALTGDQSPLDSLALINLIVALEEVIARQRGEALQLLDEDLLGEPDGPYSTPATLAAYVASAA
ncbi:hypothetical protein [Pyruvatibacter sp.]|uniref:hypothetical protein n=1 Tax=Pyruvatibacter sp. TaxID=1981328 RepID=UPI0032EBD099